jgi:hypothetical protein
MIPFERDLYVDLIAEHNQKKEEEAQKLASGLI